LGCFGFGILFDIFRLPKLVREANEKWRKEKDEKGSRDEWREENSSEGSEQQQQDQQQQQPPQPQLQEREIIIEDHQEGGRNRNHYLLHSNDSHDDYERMLDHEDETDRGIQILIEQKNGNISQESTPTSTTSSHSPIPPSISSIVPAMNNNGPAAAGAVGQNENQNSSHHHSQIHPAAAAAAAAVSISSSSSSVPVSSRVRVLYRSPRCVACLDDPINTIFLDCGHSCMCKKCAFDFMRTTGGDGFCPICRAEVRQAKQIYVTQV